MSMNEAIKKIQEASARSTDKIREIVCGKKPRKNRN